MKPVQGIGALFGGTCGEDEDQEFIARTGVEKFVDEATADGEA